MTAAIGARERKLRYLTSQEQVEGEHALGVSTAVREEFGQKLVMYGSTQTHSLGAKVSLRSCMLRTDTHHQYQAAVLLGLQFRAIPVAEADNYALRGAALRNAIEEDIEKGLTPFLVGGFCDTSTADITQSLPLGRRPQALSTE